MKGGDEMEFVYKNLENGKLIKFSVIDDKKIIAIYGKNGVGKTTFSTNKIWDKKYVFNEIFIRENIYISTDAGISTSTDNKKNLSSLFIGDDIVLLQQDKERLDKSKKRYKETEDTILDKIVGNFEVRISTSFVREIAQKYLPQIKSLDPFTQLEEVESKVPEIIVAAAIKSDTEFADQVRLFNKQEKLQSFLEIISKNSILSSLILKSDKLIEYGKLFAKVKELRKKLESKKKVDEFLVERSISTNPDVVLITKILDIQADNPNCFLCGSKDQKNGIHKWRDFVANEYNTERQKIIGDFCSLKSCIDDVMKFKKTIEEEIPKTVMFLECMNAEIDETISKIASDNLNVSSSLSPVEFENITKDSQTLKVNLIEYCIGKHAKTLVASIFQAENIDKKIATIKESLDKKMTAQTSSIVTEINTLLGQMQISKRILILLDKSAGNYKYKFTVDGREIDTLSDGQRHNLALAFFLISIKKSGLVDKTVVLDDPVVCLDEFGYHVLRNNIIGLRMAEPSLRVVILTHNIYYLYVQLSNIFESDEIKPITSFYRMSSTAVTEYDINILRIDDFTLFKNCTQKIHNEDDLLVVSGIICKMFRQFVDLKLRLKGVMFKDKPSEDIKALSLTEIEEQNLLDINRKITDITKDICNYNVNEATNLFKLLFKALKILNFDDFLEESVIIRLSQFTGTKTISDSLNIQDIYFDMIDAVNDIFYRNAYPELRNYLAHPRQQITKQITSISNDYI